MSELKEVYELEIARNAEGSKLAYMSLKDGETGYRIAGPKAWGGSKELASIEIRQDDLVEFVLSYAPQALVEILRRAQPEANADVKDALLLKLRDYVDSKSQEYGYGFYRPGNPHDFTPDADQCSDDEIAAHKAACEAYDKGEYTHDHSGCIREGGMHILHAPWGIGSYIIRDPEVQSLLDQIDAARQSTPTPDAPQAKGSEVDCG